MDQATNSVSNVAVTVVVANLANLEQFGIFATVQLAVNSAQVVALGAVGDLWLRSDTATRLNRFASGARFFAAGCAAAIVVALTLWIFGAPLVVSAAVATVPAVAGIDHLRVALIATKRATMAFRIDLMFGALQLFGIGLWTLVDVGRNAGGAWLAWGTSAYVCCVVVVVVGRRSRRRLMAVDAPPIRSAISLRFAGEMIATAGATQLVQLICALHLGVVFNGMLRAAQIPFGPLVILLQAARPVLIPAFRRDMIESSHSRTLKFSLSAGALVAAGCTGLTLIVSTVPPLRGLVGGVPLSATFIVLTGFTFLGASIHTICFYYFRATSQDAAATAGRVTLAISLLVVAAVALTVGTPTIYLIGLTVTWIVASVAMFLISRHGAFCARDR